MASGRDVMKQASWQVEGLERGLESVPALAASAKDAGRGGAAGAQLLFQKNLKPLQEMYL